MATKIFVNLPVKDLNKSVLYQTRLHVQPSIYGRDGHLHDCERGHIRHVVD
jgi:predicted lactoylglutathione lyase